MDDRPLDGPLDDPGTKTDARSAWGDIAAGRDGFVTPPPREKRGLCPRRAGPRPGRRILDVAAGTGAVGITAARL